MCVFSLIFPLNLDLTLKTTSKVNDFSPIGSGAPSYPRPNMIYSYIPFNDGFQNEGYNKIIYAYKGGHHGNEAICNLQTLFACCYQTFIVRGYI